MDKSIVTLAERCPVLEHDEQRELIRLAQAGDQKARQRVIQGNMRLVVYCVRKWVHDADLHEDMVQEGVLGVSRAIDLFDLSRVNPYDGKPIEWSTFATWHIRSALQRGRHHHGQCTAHVAIQLLETLERSAETSNRGADAARIAMAPSSYTSLDRPVSVDSDGTNTMGDVIADPAHEHTQIDEALAVRDVGRVIRACIARLPTKARNKAILTRRWLTDDSTLREIGAEHGIVWERIRQIEQKFLPMLRQRLIEAGITSADIPCGVDVVRDEEDMTKHPPKMITYQGRTQSQSAWAKEVQVSDGLLCTRLKSGWSVEDALTIRPGQPRPWRKSAKAPAACAPSAPVVASKAEAPAPPPAVAPSPPADRFARVRDLCRRLEDIDAELQAKRAERDAIEADLRTLVAA